MMVRAQRFVNRDHPLRRYPLQRSETLSSSVARKCSHGLALLFIIGLFSLASIRERDMDLHHLNYAVNTTQTSKMNNGWIPNEDIVKYSVSKEAKKENLPSSGDQLKGDYRYKPSLDSYPLSLLKNLTEPLEDTDLIFQFHIPKAAGTSTKAIFTECFHLTRAEQIATPESYKYINHVFNADTSTIAGIARAQDFGFAEKNSVDVITSSYLHEGCTLLTERHKGRLLVMMRHPVETAISLFYYLGNAKWERMHRHELKNMTLYEYATATNEGLRIDNWMTRYLSRKLKGPLEEADIQLAKNIIAQKALLGLTEDFEESMRRFDLFHGLGTWSSEGMNCVNKHIQDKANLNEHQLFGNETKEWNALAVANAIDIEIFQFAQTIYAQQGEWLSKHISREWKFRELW